MWLSRHTRLLLKVSVIIGVLVTPAGAAERLCDTAYQNCRTELLDLIKNERVRIDVSFWFMEDSRYSNTLVQRWNAGLPIRVIVDARANATYPYNKIVLDQLRTVGVPMRQKTSGGILHRKSMLFAGQNRVEFSGANFSPDAFVPVQPYTNYVDEAIYYTDDAAVVNSFKTVMDDMWTATSGYANYANVSSAPVRAYPTYAIDPDLNFPPGQNYATRAVKRYNAETQQIDVQMYRITDRRHSDAMIAAHNRGVPMRLYTDTKEYRNISRLWHAWNVDRMWSAGIPVKIPNHEGINHQKTVLLYGQRMTIFGSSNWTSASADSQAEHNYFTTKLWLFDWFADQFDRKWNNTNPTGVPETAPFVALPPDRPAYRTPVDGAVGAATNGTRLVWYGGPWAYIYDVYFGTSPNPALLAANVALGPSRGSAETQSFVLPPLTPGTTYFWKIVSKTAALMPNDGPGWSFTTSGTAPSPPSGGPTVVMWASRVPAADRHGNWTMVVDSGAAGSGSTMRTLTEFHLRRQTPPRSNSLGLPAPARFSTGFYDRLWVRLRAEGNAVSNDSVHLQFTDSVNQFGSAVMRIGTPSSAEFVLQRGPGDSSIHGWGWTDNGWETSGPPVYFSRTGTHTVRVQQREDGATIDQIVLSPSTYYSSPPGASDDDSQILPATESAAGDDDGGASLPTPWVDLDIGAPPIDGSAQYANGTFTVAASGADIWGTSDAFHFVYRPLTGDGSIQARILSLQPVHSWSKAGVMVRETLAADSKHAFMMVSAAKGVAMQWRPSTGASSLHAPGSASSAPRWVRLVRSGSTITGFESANGSTWTTVGSQSVSMAATVYVGFAVTSHSTGTATMASAESVVAASDAGSAAALPSPWVNQDMGATLQAGSAQHANGTFTVNGSGADIWNTADAFHFVYQPLTGDGSIRARVASLQHVDNWTKAGVMIRDSLGAGAKHAFMLVSAAKGVALQWRQSTNGTSSSLHAAGSVSTVPRWVRLVRTGHSISGFESADGVTWTTVGTETIALGMTVYVGLAVTSHDTAASAVATFEDVESTAG
jgi:phosphatidylserine/phosphatidylglycerophosphate/cardiolipin synthase-like enzyme/regulation of enolase protein 1 (concanavalin A-like superfamily)